MGDEIDRRFFDAADFSTFRTRLIEETEQLGEAFRNNDFSTRGNVAGFELEAWLLDEKGDPTPKNEAFLDAVDNPLVVPELAAYNIELNGSPSQLTGHVFTRLEDELAATWNACVEAGRRIDCGVMTIGILPTIRQDLLNSSFMSEVTRYQSLNDRVMAMRDGRPLNLDIQGTSHLATQHDDVMLEAATTSFQLHLQTTPDQAVRDFNACLIASAPLVAVSANSPTLFGHLLWDETRIPLFEQAVDTGPTVPPRVTFGHDYVHQSLFEIFRENEDAYPILIPALADTAERYRHLRFHNGTIWRWNRPLIGYDHDGVAHLRIEHRAVAAGPTIKDSIANAALFYGLVLGFGLGDPPERYLEFRHARDNFYAAARHSLAARVVWVDDEGEREVGMRELLETTWIPLARRGLESADVPADEIDAYLGIIEARVEGDINGARWQRQWIDENGLDLHGLVHAYKVQQDTGLPVHEWPR